MDSRPDDAGQALRGKDMEKLKAVIRALAAGEVLDPIHRDHSLLTRIIRHLRPATRFGAGQDTKTPRKAKSLTQRQFMRCPVEKCAK